MRILELNQDTLTELSQNLLKRSPNSYAEYESVVAEIIENVRSNGDEAVFGYTKKFDKADINKDNILVTEDEIKEAYQLVDEKLLI